MWDNNKGLTFLLLKSQKERRKFRIEKKKLFEKWFNKIGERYINSRSSTTTNRINPKESMPRYIIKLLKMDDKNIYIY